MESSTVVAEFLLVLLPWVAFASGPPENMGHLHIQIKEQEALFDLQVPAQVTYNLGLPRGQAFKFGRLDPEVALPLFQNSLGVSRLHAEDSPCEWDRHEVILAAGISRIRALAHCAREISSLRFEFPFLKKESADFLVAGTSNLQGFENFQMRPGNWKIYLGSSWGFVVVLSVGLAVVLALVFLILNKMKRQNPGIEE